MHLLSHKGKALSQFEQKVCNMPGKPIFYILFAAMCIRSCKIKQIWIFEHIANHI